MATGFVKKTLKKAHGTLVERLVEKAHIRETKLHNMRLEEHNSNSILSYYSDPRSPGLASPLLSSDVSQARPNANEAPNSLKGPWNLDHRGSLSQAPYPYSPPMEGMQQAPVDPRYSQPSPQSKYSQPPPDPRYALPPEDARYSKSPVQGHDPRMMHEAYTPVELPSSAASSQPQRAELGSL